MVDTEDIMLLKYPKLKFDFEISSRTAENHNILYFVSSRERPWRHWACQRIHAARRILYLGVPFWTREKTHRLRARWQAPSSGRRADVTIVLEVRQSIVTFLFCVKNYTRLYLVSGNRPVRSSPFCCRKYFILLIEKISETIYAKSSIIFKRLMQLVGQSNVNVKLHTEGTIYQNCCCA